MNINIELKNVNYGGDVKTEILETTEAGEYLPSEGFIGFSKVIVDFTVLTSQQIQNIINEIWNNIDN